MPLVAAWELIALDDQGDGTQRITAVADTPAGMRLVTTTVALSPAEAEALRAKGIRQPWDEGQGGQLRRST